MEANGLVLGLCPAPPAGGEAAGSGLPLTSEASAAHGNTHHPHGEEMNTGSWVPLLRRRYRELRHCRWPCKAMAGAVCTRGRCAPGGRMHQGHFAVGDSGHRGQWTWGTVCSGGQYAAGDCMQSVTVCTRGQYAVGNSGHRGQYAVGDSGHGTVCTSMHAFLVALSS